MINANNRTMLLQPQYQTLQYQTGAVNSVIMPQSTYLIQQQQQQQQQQKQTGY